MTPPLTAFISRRWGVPEAHLNIQVQPLHGGLQSPVVWARITSGEGDSERSQDLVVKRLSGDLAREAEIYQALWRHLDRPPAVQMLGRDVSGDSTFLFLEHATSSSPWPWRDTAFAASVCRELATLHDSPHLPREPFAWNYEDQLTWSAEETLEFAAAARDGAGRRIWGRLGDLRRVVRALPALRRRLLRNGAIVIHGDVHPGNVIVRSTAPQVDVVLIDWARARLGSPLEDIASWLHSLGCWEPQARRRHDTLMRAYLDARVDPRALDPATRVEYWFASASNGLAGAIRHHLSVLAGGDATQLARSQSSAALIAWERVIRRAAALLNTNLDR